MGTSPSAAASDASLETHGLFEERQVCKVFGSANNPFAGADARQRQDADLPAKPADAAGAPVFALKRLQTVDLVKEVHQGTVRQFNDRIRPNRGAEGDGQIQHPHVLASGQIHPEVRVERRGRDSLQNGPAHAHYLKPNLLRSERV